MASENDDWNKDLFAYFKDHPSIKFFFEDRKLGKHGRHLFFNELAEKSTGEWVLHTCDDQMFIIDGWDNYIRSLAKSIDSSKINIIIPQFSNTGDVDHFLSRGYIKAMGMGGYGNIDSWINEVRDVMPPDRIHRTPEAIMYDMTVDVEIFTPEYLTADTSEGDKLPKWETTEVQASLEADRQKVKEAINAGL